MSSPNHNQTHAVVLARYRRYLLLVWFAWLGLRLLVMPWAMWQATQVFDGTGFVLWQMFVLLPALCLTPAVYRTKSAYALIITSLVLMVYWAAAASQLLTAWYQAQALLAVIYGVETLLLAVVFVWLFLFTKKMPAMHKQRTQD